MRLSTQPVRWLVVVVLILGVLAISTSAIFIRLTIEAVEARGVGFSLVIAALRLSLASLILLPAWRKIQLAQLGERGAGFYALAAGAVLALHFATWITSLSYTSIAASTALVTTNPVWVAILSRFWFKEKLSLLQIIGIAIALTGAIVIGVADANSAFAGSNPLLGDFLALAGSWTVSLYFLLGREAQQRGIGLGGYVALAYTTAALILLPLPFALGIPYAGYPKEVYFYILLMAIFPQLLGHTSVNWALLWISPTFVTLAILFEPVFASLLGYWVFGEMPKLQVLAGAAVLLCGVAIAAVGSSSRSSPQTD